MSEKERQLKRRICYIEDEVLRCKNHQKAVELSYELNKMRKQLSKLRFESA